jgi:hypothetical protein
MSDARPENEHSGVRWKTWTIIALMFSIIASCCLTNQNADDVIALLSSSIASCCLTNQNADDVIAYLWPYESAGTKARATIQGLNDWNSASTVVQPGPCNLPTIKASELTQEVFLEDFAYKTPFVVRDYTLNTGFAFNCTREALLANFGYSQIVLSSANTNSYAKKRTTLAGYITDDLDPQSESRLGNETFYFFGDNNYTEWQPLFTLYNMPPVRIPRHLETISFGIGAAGTGVPFHFHGPGFAETIFGRKRWFLTPPDSPPSFDGDTSSLSWFLNDYETSKAQIMECTLGPTDLIYFPDRWWHATLNIDTSVFVSVFLSP